MLNPHIEGSHERQKISAIVVELVGERGEMGGDGTSGLCCRAASKFDSGSRPTKVGVQIGPQELVLFGESPFRSQP